MAEQNGPKSSASNAVLEKLSVYNTKNQNDGPEETTAGLSSTNLNEGAIGGRQGLIYEYKMPEISGAAHDRIKKLMSAKTGTTGAATLEGYKRKAA